MGSLSVRDQEIVGSLSGRVQEESVGSLSGRVQEESVGSLNGRGQEGSVGSLSGRGQEESVGHLLRETMRRVWGQSLGRPGRKGGVTQWERLGGE